MAISSVGCIFQSTLPRGERHLYGTLKLSDFGFQSTLPRGERLIMCNDYRKVGYRISIHAPTRGATFWIPWVNGYAGFQSTLPRGERQQFYTKFHICFISFLPILSLHHISTHSPLPTFNHFLYIFSGANRPGISCLLPFRTKTISGIL